jgi:hypothetical protein
MRSVNTASNRLINAKKNAAHPIVCVRFPTVEEWQMVANEAERQGVPISVLIRTYAIEGVARGRKQTHHQTNRALATKRSA